MSQSELQKRGFLTLERGGLADRRELTPEALLQRELTEWAVRGKIVSEFGRLRYATRSLENIGGGSRPTGRPQANTIATGLEKGLSTSWAMDYGRIWVRYAIRRARADGRVVDLLGAA